jgi:hypothetical protein
MRIAGDSITHSAALDECSEDCSGHAKVGATRHASWATAPRAHGAMCRASAAWQQPRTVDDDDERDERPTRRSLRSLTRGLTLVPVSCLFVQRLAGAVRDLQSGGRSHEPRHRRDCFGKGTPHRGGRWPSRIGVPSMSVAGEPLPLRQLEHARPWVRASSRRAGQGESTASVQVARGAPGGQPFSSPRAMASGGAERASERLPRPFCNAPSPDRRPGS